MFSLTNRNRNQSQWQTCFHVLSRVLSQLYVLWECLVFIAFFARCWDVIGLFGGFWLVIGLFDCLRQLQSAHNLRICCYGYTYEKLVNSDLRANPTTLCRLQFFLPLPLASPYTCRSRVTSHESLLAGQNDRACIPRLRPFFLAPIYFLAPATQARTIAGWFFSK